MFAKGTWKCQVIPFLELKRIKWKFNFEVSPWQGSHFERMVRSVKRCLQKVLGNAKVSYDELHTISSEVECILNNRLLTYSYDEWGGEVNGVKSCVPGRVNALRKAFNTKFYFKGIFKRICSFLKARKSCRVSTSLPMTQAPP